MPDTAQRSFYLIFHNNLRAAVRSYAVGARLRRQNQPWSPTHQALCWGRGLMPLEERRCLLYTKATARISALGALITNERETLCLPLSRLRIRGTKRLRTSLRSHGWQEVVERLVQQPDLQPRLSTRMLLV